MFWGGLCNIFIPANNLEGTRLRRQQQRKSSTRASIDIKKKFEPPRMMAMPFGGGTSREMRPKEQPSTTPAEMKGSRRLSLGGSGASRVAQVVTTTRSKMGSASRVTQSDTTTKALPPSASKRRMTFNSARQVRSSVSAEGDLADDAVAPISLLPVSRVMEMGEGCSFVSAAEFFADPPPGPLSKAPGTTKTPATRIEDEHADAGTPYTQLRPSLASFSMQSLRTTQPSPTSLRTPSPAADIPRARIYSRSHDVRAKEEISIVGAASPVWSGYAALNRSGITPSPCSLEVQSILGAQAGQARHAVDMSHAKLSFSQLSPPPLSESFVDTRHDSLDGLGGLRSIFALARSVKEEPAPANDEDVERPGGLSQMLQVRNKHRRKLMACDEAGEDLMTPVFANLSIAGSRDCGKSGVPSGVHCRGDKIPKLSFSPDGFNLMQSTQIFGDVDTGDRNMSCFPSFATSNLATHSTSASDLFTMKLNAMRDAGEGGIVYSSALAEIKTSWPSHWTEGAAESEAARHTPLPPTRPVVVAGDMITPRPAARGAAAKSSIDGPPVQLAFFAFGATPTWPSDETPPALVPNLDKSRHSARKRTRSAAGFESPLLQRIAMPSLHSADKDLPSSWTLDEDFDDELAAIENNVEAARAVPVLERKRRSQDPLASKLATPLHPMNN